MTAPETEVALPSFAALGYGQDLLRAWSSEFEVQLGSYIFSDEGTLPEEAEVWLKRGIVVLQGCRAVTDSGWESLCQVLKSLPKVKLPNKVATSVGRRPAVSHEDLEREPWLFDYLRCERSGLVLSQRRHQVRRPRLSCRRRSTWSTREPGRRRCSRSSRTCGNARPHWPNHAAAPSHGQSSAEIGWIAADLVRSTASRPEQTAPTGGAFAGRPA